MRLIKKLELCLFFLPVILNASQSGSEENNVERLAQAVQDSLLEVTQARQKLLDEHGRLTSELAQLQARQAKKDKLFEEFKAKVIPMMASLEQQGATNLKHLEDLKAEVAVNKLERARAVIAARDKENEAYLSSTFMPASTKPWQRPFVCSSETAYESAIKSAPWNQKSDNK